MADRGERLGAYLRRADGDQILRDVEDFARKQPWLMVGGSAVAGFLASRFMKATSRERFQGSGRMAIHRGRAPARTRASRFAGQTSRVRCPVREGMALASTDQTRANLHEQPIGELLKQLANETTTLVRQELDLAKAEMREKGRVAGPALGMIGAAGGVALLAPGH